MVGLLIGVELLTWQHRVFVIVSQWTREGYVAFYSQPWKFEHSLPDVLLVTGEPLTLA